ncbi:MAG: type VII toxin-antitoxin system MntA family adenylyltransferase antitoxin [Microcoleaceae cyanobacterium]
MSTKNTILEIKTLAQQIPKKIPYIKTLILFGSRARGDIHADSDWDFAVFYDRTIRENIIDNNIFATWEIPVLLAEIFNISSDKIDLIDLDSCNPLIAHFVARDGQLLYESHTGDFLKFQQSFLMNDQQLTQIKQGLRQSINDFLLEWGLV